MGSTFSTRGNLGLGFLPKDTLAFWWMDEGRDRTADRSTPSATASWHSCFYCKCATAAYKLLYTLSRPLRLMEVCCDCSGSVGGASRPVTVSWTRRTAHARWNNNKLRLPLGHPPSSSCHPVKTKTQSLSLSADHILCMKPPHPQNKNPLRSAPCAHRRRGAEMSPRGKPLRTDAAPARTAQLLPRTSAKPMFTFTTPHLDRNIVWS